MEKESKLETKLTGQKCLNLPVVERKLRKIAIPVEEVGYATSLGELEKEGINLEMLNEGSEWLTKTMQGDLYILDKNKKNLFRFHEGGGVEVPYSPLMESLLEHSKIGGSKYDPSYG